MGLSRSPGKGSFGIVAAVVAGALLLGSGAAIQSVARSLLFEEPLGAWNDVGEPILTWLLLAGLTPIAFAATRRFPFGRGGVGRALAAHLVAGFAFAGLGVVLVAALLAASRPELGFAVMATKTGGAYFVYYLAIYAALVGVLHAVHYQREARQRAEQLVRVRLEALRRQLDPHFLFNSLNAISTLALEGDSERVAEGLGRVADLLRATLDDDLPQEIPLARELELADKYLGIQETRFGERLRVEREIEPAVLDALVPSMILQPLIENAVDHGVATVPGDGWVRLVARGEQSGRGRPRTQAGQKSSSSTGERLRLEVLDSGAGFDGNPSGGIGLANTRERLQTLYGAAHRLTLGAAEDGGARVELTIPLRRAPRTGRP